MRRTGGMEASAARQDTRKGGAGDVATNPTGCKVEANTSGCTCSSCYCRPCNDTRSTSGRHNFKGKDPRFETTTHRERERREADLTNESLEVHIL